jgi:hypothetical protein
MLLLGAASTPCLATHWVEVGVSGPDSDSLLVDTDSLRMADGLRVLDIMTRYSTPRRNANDLMLDRFVQTTAFDCKKRTYALVRTVGYLGEQHFGSDHEVEGWPDKMSPVPDDSLSKRIFGIACPSDSPGAH